MSFLARVISAEGEDTSDFQPVQTIPEIDKFDFVFFKATEALSWTGQTFAGNWSNAKAAKKPRGAYHFFHPSLSATRQAQHFLNVVKAQGLEDGDMLVIDTEIMFGMSASAAIRAYGRSHVLTVDFVETATADLVDAGSKAFLDELVKLGVDPKRNPIMVYTNHDVGQHLVTTALAYPLLWFAWPSSTAPDATLIAPWHRWLFWQWGAVNGVDRDAFNGTVAELTTFLASYTAAPARTITVVVTDGKTSLHDICVDYDDRAHEIVSRTLAHGLHPVLVAYLAAHPALEAPMPAGIHLYVATGKAV